jgi:hypothetical protein
MLALRVCARYSKKFNIEKHDKGEKNDFDDLPLFPERYGRALFRHTTPALRPVRSRV